VPSKQVNKKDCFKKSVDNKKMAWYNVCSKANNKKHFKGEIKTWQQKK
jgi:hypothetical protein